MRLSLSLSLTGGSANPLASYATGLDFTTQDYWRDGVNYAALSSLPGYAFTDSVDNVPNIDATGYESLSSQSSALELGAALPAGDFVAWAVITMTGLPPSTCNPFYFSTAGPGDSATVALVQLSIGGALSTLVNVGGVAQSAPANIASVIASGGGTAVLAIRRSASKYSIGARKTDGTVAVTTAASTGSVPAIAAVDVGASRVGTAQLNGKVKFFGQRNVTLSDAEFTALLEAA